MRLLTPCPALPPRTPRAPLPHITHAWFSYLPISPRRNSVMSRCEVPCTSGGRKGPRGGGGGRWREKQGGQLPSWSTSRPVSPDSDALPPRSPGDASCWSRALAFSSALSVPRAWSLAGCRRRRCSCSCSLPQMQQKIDTGAPARPLPLQTEPATCAYASRFSIAEEALLPGTLDTSVIAPATICHERTSAAQDTRH